MGTYESQAEGIRLESINLKELEKELARYKAKERKSKIGG